MFQPGFGVYSVPQPLDEGASPKICFDLLHVRLVGWGVQLQLLLQLAALWHISLDCIFQYVLIPVLRSSLTVEPVVWFLLLLLPILSLYLQVRSTCALLEVRCNLWGLHGVQRNASLCSVLLRELWLLSLQCDIPARTSTCVEHLNSVP